MFQPLSSSHCFFYTQIRGHWDRKRVREKHYSVHPFFSDWIISPNKPIHCLFIIGLMLECVLIQILSPYRGIANIILAISKYVLRLFGEISRAASIWKFCQKLMPIIINIYMSITDCQLADIRYKSILKVQISM